MDNKITNTGKIVKYWIEASEQDFNTMTHLFKTKDYHWALLVGHLVLEKLLKASIVKTTSKHAPFTHDLRRLARLSGVELNDSHLEWLDTITTFNINARYDSYKQEFYKKCTLTYTSKWIENIKDLRQWIKTKL